MVNPLLDIYMLCTLNSGVYGITPDYDVISIHELLANEIVSGRFNPLYTEFHFLEVLLRLLIPCVIHISTSTMS